MRGICTGTDVCMLLQVLLEGYFVQQIWAVHPAVLQHRFTDVVQYILYHTPLMYFKIIFLNLHVFCENFTHFSGTENDFNPSIPCKISICSKTLPICFARKQPHHLRNYFIRSCSSAFAASRRSSTFSSICVPILPPLTIISSSESALASTNVL